MKINENSKRQELLVNEIKKNKVLSNNGNSNVVLNPQKSTGYEGSVLAFQNNSKYNVAYWYSDDGKNKWYPHTIVSKGSSWDWQWSNGWTGYAMVIELPLNDKESKYIVPAFQEYYQPERSTEEYPLTNIFTQVAPRSACPSFDNGNWNWEFSRLFPGKIDYAFTYHTGFVLNEDGSYDWQNDII